MPAIALCKECRTHLVITHDALERPRFRCPNCEGVGPVREIGRRGISQAALDTSDKYWPAPAAKDHVPRPRAQYGVPKCRHCGTGLEYSGAGRPRLYCADANACSSRKKNREYGDFLLQRAS